MDQEVKILLIEDNPGDARLIEILLDDEDDEYFKVWWVDTLTKAKNLISEMKFDAILLDLNLPDSSGIMTVKETCRIAQHVPIIILTGNNDLEISMDSLRCGAQDYLVKGEFDDNLLKKSVYHAYQRNKIKLELEKREKELEIANANKDKLFSIISHDIRSPFNSILGYLEIFHENINDLTPKEISEYSGSLLDSARIVMGLIQNLFNWSRIQRGKIEINPQDINLSEILDQIVQLYEGNAAQKQLKILKNFENNLRIRGDQDLLDTVVRNLLNNAIKFTPKNGQISLNVESDPINITIEIQDSGIGIEEEKISTILSSGNFESTAGTENEMGSGLGLAVCQELIKLQKGKLVIESTQNIGSKFSVIIPRELN
ncbi:MAG: hybrid sensor histidine kinase/response regulator [Melioribacteraceae bacterium]|nr:hybrid sensor histidine kinase/response regulator [Melioribacteraceae bacterium]MCF8265901.1 hybrid sensor histidine kinase/response regulator [Melioribacteraceae bacterium]MCF8413502.1 hybrid sensor histidine kinase/response regulator [Melioribacteraceae bacterium]MCF8431711.1 hybrid sensor histidine kinase/response regulator [Melioribacteraceae bacterium]